MRKFLASLMLLGLLAPSSVVRADAYHANPKLVVVLVIDQFRGDYLDRYRDDFKTANGFNLFLNRGAYFTDCYYDYANTMTAPGHSTIGTGAYTDGHGISVNEWWDLKRSTTHAVSSVEDERYAIVGDPASKEPGASPRNELASTLGDEVVLATQGRAKLFGVSLKDRAAILTSGHASNGAFWLDHADGKFITSTYWMAKMPKWAEDFNNNGEREAALKQAGAREGNFYEEVGKKPVSVKYLIDFTKALVEGEKLGKHEVTDVLTISISSTDILGHAIGPDAPEQRAMIDAIDVQLNDFFSFLDKYVDGGLGQVWVGLSGDHGVSPVPAVAAKEGMPAATFSVNKVIQELNARMNERFSPGEKKSYMLTSEASYLQLDPRAFAGTKVTEAEAENAAAEMLPDAFAATLGPEPRGLSEGRAAARSYVRHVYTRAQMASGQIPDTEEGRLIRHSYSPNGGWFVLATYGMYQMSAKNGTNHFTPYMYDRHVPLAFYGAPFVPGTYHGRVGPVDMAATFASLLRINQPSAAVGHVLTEAIRPERAATPAAGNVGRAQ